MASIGTINFRGAAEYVDRILKGTKPTDLPVEQPTKFELSVKSKTAKTVGLEVPPSLLGRAPPQELTVAAPREVRLWHDSAETNSSE